jgi:hypothetical protein
MKNERKHNRGIGGVISQSSPELGVQSRLNNTYEYYYMAKEKPAKESEEQQAISKEIRKEWSSI